MGIAASLIDTERKKPILATDVTNFDEARFEVIRLRKLLLDQQIYLVTKKLLNADTKRKIIIITGPPCSGKRTRAPYITEILGIPQLSTGDMLRAAIKAGTDIGKQAEEIMMAGGLVNDQLVVQIVKKRIEESDCVQGFILDGFPRTLQQAHMLDSILKPERVSMVLALDVEDEVLFDRICGRWIHQPSGRSYHSEHNPPKSLQDSSPTIESMLDDETSEPLIQRADDTEEALKERLLIYDNHTTPLLNYYSSLVVDMDSNEYSTKEVIKSEMYKILDTHFLSPPPTVPIKCGATIPNMIFKARVRNAKIKGDNPFEWKDISTDDLFKGKRAVIFCLPGAFTPLCSSTHLPGYEEKYDDIKNCGIDDVYCLSVNDAFVMRQWGINLNLETEDDDTDSPLNPGNFKKVKMLPDGAALFTRGMGMSTQWETERGFGERSWRYSVVINDNKVEKLFIENDGVPIQNHGPDPFEISDAETMLNYLTCANNGLTSDFTRKVSVAISRASSFMLPSAKSSFMVPMSNAGSTRFLIDHDRGQSTRLLGVSQSTPVLP